MTNNLQELSELIKIIGERIIKIEKTLLYYNKKIDEKEKNFDIELIKNIDIRIKKLETIYIKKIQTLENKIKNLEKENSQKASFKASLQREREIMIDYIEEEKSKISESQNNLKNNIEILENSIKVFSKKIKSRKS